MLKFISLQKFSCYIRFLARSDEISRNEMHAKIYKKIFSKTRSKKAAKLRAMMRFKNYWMTRTIILINCIVYYYVWSHGGINEENLLHFGANFRPLVLGGEWWRLFTCIFLHASLIHIGANMYSMWVLGRMMENLAGVWATFTVYMLTGVFASLVSVLYHTQPVIGIGASGAIFGLFGAFAALVFRKKVMTVGGQVMGMKSLLPPLMINFAISMMPEIDLSAHLGGFVGGFILGFFLK